MLITSARSDKDKPHQEHRLETVSNNIIGVGVGLTPVLRDPNPRPRSWYGSYMLIKMMAVISINAFNRFSHS